MLLSCNTLSDKRRVELALPAALLYRVFSRCVEVTSFKAIPGQLTGDRVVLDWLALAAIEPMSDLDEKRARKLSARVSRLQRDLLLDFEGRPVMVAFLIVLFWLKGLLDTDRLVLVEGSVFDKAVSVLVPELAKHDDLWMAMERTAIKNARKIADRLENEGYYR